MPSMAAPSYWLMPEMPWQPATTMAQAQAQCEADIAAHGAAKPPQQAQTAPTSPAAGVPAPQPAPAATAEQAPQLPVAPQTQQQQATETQPGLNDAKADAVVEGQPLEAQQPDNTVPTAGSTAPCPEAEAKAAEVEPEAEAEGLGSPADAEGAPDAGLEGCAADDEDEEEEEEEGEGGGEGAEAAADGEGCEDEENDPVTTTGRRKTKLCKLWQENRCRRRRCPFAHGEADLRQYVPSEEKSKKADKKDAPPAWMRCALQVTDTYGESPSEVVCLGAFMQPSAEQRGHRSTIRDMVHHTVLEHVDRSAITKVTGPTASCVELFDADLDLIVDTSEAEQYAGEHATQLCSAMSAMGVMCRTTTRDCDGVPLVVFDSCAMSVVHQKWSRSHFKVYVSFCPTGLSTERREFSATQAALQRNKGQRILIPAITAVMRSLSMKPKFDVTLTQRCVLVLCLAFFEHSRTHYRFDDHEWVFREFFSFFARFDFKGHGVCVADSPFPRKISEDNVLVQGMVPDDNCAADVDREKLQRCFAFVDEHLAKGRPLRDLITRDLVKQRDIVLYESSDPEYVTKERELVATLSKLETLLSAPCNHVHRATVRNTLLHFHASLPVARTLPESEQNVVQVHAERVYNALFDPES